ncbi:hypothetical protein NC653_020836 [Populus alba x Populus x berolinensis]|uniref:Uncharacterized protein n=2 Tax=Populus TaxID=3689 RepID=A0A4U5PZD5_POPAL|nr:hypothetical protein NC653_020836 [Populus alba x Populus x berolinensis]TKS02990.1 hypothetical protein D5086_0000157810 [Populus alba]
MSVDAQPQSDRCQWQTHPFNSGTFPQKRCLTDRKCINRKVQSIALHPSDFLTVLVEGLVDCHLSAKEFSVMLLVNDNNGLGKCHLTCRRAFHWLAFSNLMRRNAHAGHVPHLNYTMSSLARMGKAYRQEKLSELLRSWLVGEGDRGGVSGGEDRREDAGMNDWGVSEEKEGKGGWRGCGGSLAARRRKKRKKKGQI